MPNKQIATRASEWKSGWLRTQDELVKDLEEELPSAYIDKLSDAIRIQMWGWAIILEKDGAWYPVDTSG